MVMLNPYLIEIDIALFTDKIMSEICLQIHRKKLRQTKQGDRMSAEAE